jgi:hypothetical protein
MMADRQWFLTKLVGSLMGLFILMSTGIGTANIVLDVKRDVSVLKVDVVKVDDKAEVLEDEVHLLQLSNAVGEAHYQAILTELAETKKEVANLNILNMKILEILSNFEVM